MRKLTTLDMEKINAALDTLKRTQDQGKSVTEMLGMIRVIMMDDVLYNIVLELFEA